MVPRTALSTRLGESRFVFNGLGPAHAFLLAEGDWAWLYVPQLLLGHGVSDLRVHLNELGARILHVLESEPSFHTSRHGVWLEAKVVRVA